MPAKFPIYWDNHWVRMSPERWRQVEELFHAVREHGPAALADADAEVRREAEELLAQNAGDHFLDQPLAESGLAGQTAWGWCTRPSTSNSAGWWR
jgi:hypothetical protein